MSDLQVNGGPPNIESLHEDSFLAQAMNLQEALRSPRRPTAAQSLTAQPQAPSSLQN